MKGIVILALSLLFSIKGFGQDPEFKQYSNGLIYSEETMEQLAHIVDSLNLKFLFCDVDRKYFAKSQVVCHKIRLDSGKVREARADMENDIGLEDFKRKYPMAEIIENVLVVRFQYRDYEGNPIIEFSEIPVSDRYGMDIRMENRLEDYSGRRLKSPWVFNYLDKGQYWDESLEAFYITGELETRQIPEKYSSMIGYSECLIDTTVSKFKDEAEEGWVELPENWQEMSAKKQEKLLDEMRSTRVIGRCSMDNGPRDHAVNIALLSAETANWEVFLRAHLDIMNDRFERVSDGSYAWGRRQTYIRELEDLDINVKDLILGICLRIENPVAHHYFGNIGRIGRALAETQDRERIENEILGMIRDPALDDYNRIIGVFLFDHFIYFTDDESLKRANIRQLREAVASLPAYLSGRISIDENKYFRD